MQHSGFHEFQIIKKIHPLLDKWVKVTRIVAKDPLAIGGQSGRSIREIIPQEFSKTQERNKTLEKPKIWEANIRYYQSYLYDRDLWPGMAYRIQNNQLKQEKVDDKILNKIHRCFCDSRIYDI